MTERQLRGAYGEQPGIKAKFDDGAWFVGRGPTGVAEAGGRDHISARIVKFAMIRRPGHRGSGRGKDCASLPSPPCKLTSRLFFPSEAKEI
ncbi:hypothetical protein CEXT_396761 [Caerostris extrusa]|uniref:Uncharacterized protein n=1 Tax=Caerostris extrusa TaxID=172846 RepID=A0AAV4W586_CAEEX|nr:hypothetical protein CEXT_396761 [Caerostris extrusa]